MTKLGQICTFWTDPLIFCLLSEFYSIPILPEFCPLVLGWFRPIPRNTGGLPKCKFSANRGAIAPLCGGLHSLPCPRDRLSLSNAHTISRSLTFLSNGVSQKSSDPLHSLQSMVSSDTFTVSFQSDARVSQGVVWPCFLAGKTEYR